MKLTIITKTLVKLETPVRDYYLTTGLYVFLMSRSALEYFLSNVRADKGCTQETPIGGLMFAFPWHRSPQGTQYWSDLAQDYYSQATVTNSKPLPDKCYKEVI